MAATERMASVDAAWLHMDRPTNLMVVTCVFWFDRPLDWDRVAAAFTERLVPAFPRFAQRVVEPPVTFGLIGPRWADVDDFDVRGHLRRVVLPAPGGDAELHAHVSGRADRPLDPGRPLWEADLIDGYGDGCAVLLRTHHAIADGTALVQALLTLADPPDGRPSHAGQRTLAAGSAFGLPSRGLLRPPGGDGGRPGLMDHARAAVDRTAMLQRLGFAAADEPSVLRGPLSGRKLMTWSPPVPLEQVKRAGQAVGATVNDVALAAVAGALRRHLLAHGQPVERLTAVVPVNLRPPDQPLDPRRGNQFGLAFVRLPVGEPDPRARLRAVQTAMARVKATGEGLVVSGALAVMGQTPVQLEQRWLDLFAGRATAVVTNIAGPREPVALAGVPLRGFTAWVPSTGPIGVGLSICSYAGNLLVGVAVDEALVPDSDQLLAALTAEVAAFSRTERPGSDD
ncbi:wax ester/triacylglycerol synthase family O-acyltransferase [Blastococcus sp. SYSU DS0619]